MNFFLTKLGTQGVVKSLSKRHINIQVLGEIGEYGNCSKNIFC